MGSGDPLGADHPERCCDGLTAYTRGGSEWVMEEGCVQKNYSTVPSGYWCIKCGDGICNRDAGEDLCSCPQDCKSVSYVSAKTCDQGCKEQGFGSGYCANFTTTSQGYKRACGVDENFYNSLTRDCTANNQACCCRRSDLLIPGKLPEK